MNFTKFSTMVAVVTLHVKANNAKYLHKVLMKTEYTFWEYNTSMIKDVFEWFSAVKHVFIELKMANKILKQSSYLNLHDI